MVFGLSEKERKERRVSRFAEKILIKKAVVTEKKRQALFKFERRKAKAFHYRPYSRHRLDDWRSTDEQRQRNSR